MKQRSLPVPVILAALVLVGALAGCAFAGTAAGGGGETVAWNLTGMGGANSSFDQHHPFDVSKVQDMTSFDVHVEQWPADDSTGSEWLTPSIDYGSDAVTVTLRVSDAYRARTGSQTMVGWYDTGGWVTVALREPLRSRRLVDGATGRTIPYPSPR